MGCSVVSSIVPVGAALSPPQTWTFTSFGLRVFYLCPPSHHPPTGRPHLLFFFTFGPMNGPEAFHFFCSSGFSLSHHVVPISLLEEELALERQSVQSRELLVVDRTTGVLLCLVVVHGQCIPPLSQVNQSPSLRQCPVLVTAVTRCLHKTQLSTRPACGP